MDIYCVWDVHVHVRPVFFPSQIQDMIGGCSMGGACGHFKDFGLSSFPTSKKILYWRLYNNTVFHNYSYTYIHVPRGKILNMYDIVDVLYTGKTRITTYSRTSNKLKDPPRKVKSLYRGHCLGSQKLPFPIVWTFYSLRTSEKRTTFL